MVHWWPGYMGNVFYMTAGLNSNDPIILTTMWNHTYQPNGLDDNAAFVNNAVNLTIGQDAATPLTGSAPIMYEFYEAPSPSHMQIYIPIATAGGSQLNMPGVTIIYGVYCQGVYTTLSSAPGQTLQFTTTMDSGINVTGTVDQPTTKSQYLWNLGLDALGFLPLPGVGFAIGTYSVMNDLEGLTYVDGNSVPNPSSGATAILNDTLTNGTWSQFDPNGQNVWTSQSYLNAQIPSSDFGYSPVFHFSADNFLGYFGATCDHVSYGSGASANLNVPVYPAGAITGTVYGGPSNTPLPGAVVGLTQGTTTYDVTSHNLQPSGVGMYAFAGQSGTGYSVSAAYSAPFGTVASTHADSLVAPSATSAAATGNLYIPLSYIHGSVSCSGCPSTPMVVVTNTATNQQYTTYAYGGTYGMFIGALGTYHVFAGVGKYSSPTDTVSVTSWNTSYAVPTLYLTSSGGGCVLSGTSISVPGGTRAVDTLKPGDTVYGFDPASGTGTDETVLSNAATSVGQVLSINHGLLDVTMWEQPLLVQNGTWTGWVNDPVNLLVGERLYDPSTNSWIAITSLRVLIGSFTVYDLRVTAPHDFMANGVLALDKIG